MDTQEAQEAFARLSVIAAVGAAQVKANPVRHINKVCEENVRLMRAIDEAMHLLSGGADWDICREEYPSMPPNVVETALDRNSRAYTVLQKASVGD